jgi:hypothetical protein
MAKNITRYALTLATVLAFAATSATPAMADRPHGPANGACTVWASPANNEAPSNIALGGTSEQPHGKGAENTEQACRDYLVRERDN